MSYVLQLNAKDLIGTAAAPVTLTAAFSANQSSALVIAEYSKLTFEIDYTPVISDRKLVIQYEVSFDNTNFYKDTGKLTGIENKKLRILNTEFDAIDAATAHKLIDKVEFIDYYLRVSMKELVASDNSNPSASFGTAHIRVILPIER